jgi:leucyl aminopeptidase (aminopeptidase T)
VVGSDKTGRIIGEFGIGTVHFAIGDSYGIGKNKSRYHFDALVDKVTIRAKGKLIAKNGKFLI